MRESELIGKTDLDLPLPEIAEFYRQVDREMFSSGKARRNEEWIPFHDGGGGHFETRSSFIRLLLSVLRYSVDPFLGSAPFPGNLENLFRFFLLLGFHFRIEAHDGYS